MRSRADLEAIAMWLDHIASIDSTGRDVAPRLVRAAQELYGRAASLRAAEVLTAAPLSGRVALITTGFVLTGTNAIETDGPPGAVALARAVGRLFGSRVLLLTDPPGVVPLRSCAQALGLDARDPGELLRAPAGAVAVVSLPFDRGQATPIAERIMSRYEPAALIAIEKPGPNERGVYHLTRGIDWSAHSAPVDLLYERRDDAVTVGIGDFGNEVGMGTLGDSARDLLEFGHSCPCGCGGGVVDATQVDAVVPAAVSNWGAFAVCGALAAATDDASIVPTRDEERRMLDACIANGALEGLSRAAQAGVDGVSLEADLAIVELMREMVTRYGAVRDMVRALSPRK